MMIKGNGRKIQLKKIWHEQWMCFHELHCILYANKTATDLCILITRAKSSNLFKAVHLAIEEIQQLQQLPEN